MIKELNQVFFLQTQNTEYRFRVTQGGYLEHIFYGDVLGDPNIQPLTDKFEFVAGNTIEVKDGNRQIGMEHLKGEMSSHGKGDVREVFVDLIHGDGSRTCDFVYHSHQILPGKYTLEGLPSSYSEKEQADTLIVRLEDRNSGSVLELLYGVFYDTDIITRSARLTNEETGPIRIRRLMSLQLDLDEFDDYDYIGFNGEWTNEMNLVRRPLLPGIMGNASYCGTSSNRSNPLTILCSRDAGEEHGDVYGFNLIYSGNHYESTYTDALGKVRFLQGINPAEFEYRLSPGEIFTAPEAIMTYSSEGFGKMSRNFHSFINHHIVRGFWKQKERPILINSWESFYFNIHEKNLYQLAKTASKMGIELFVIDDGWFLNRNDDTSSLGDWVVDPKKMPNGLGAFAKSLKALNMDLGIWVEPEMINENSNLYREHPEYAVKIPAQDHALGRNQMILNLTMKEVQDYIIESMTKVFSSGGITYVKWDMNRVLSDSYGWNLPPEEQLSFAHAYTLGLYVVLEALTKRFPEILFESCSSGGNRFDLGMLCYMPQTWASDNTDARCRTNIQYGYSFGYPLSTMSAHVSQCPNHQTLRTTLLETRFDVAAFGVLGYECNFDDFTKFELDQMALQIEFYKQYRKVLQFGEFYRLSKNDNQLQWMVTSPDATTGLAMFYKYQVIPGAPYDRIRLKGLLPDVTYEFRNRQISFRIKEFGSLINNISPVPIRMNSLLHNLIDKFKHIDSEMELVTGTGQLFMKGGIKLKEGFACRGFNENIRFMPDNGTRLYMIEKVK